MYRRVGATTSPSSAALSLCAGRNTHACRCRSFSRIRALPNDGSIDLREQRRRLAKLFYQRAPQTAHDTSQPAQAQQEPQPDAGHPAHSLDRSGEKRPERQQQDGSWLPAGAPPHIIAALPLWRVEWAVLPGQQAILHVHAPHYVHMFDALFSAAATDDSGEAGGASTRPSAPCAGARAPHMAAQACPQQHPVRFGHLYLPHGSRNLGSPDYALASGSSAPLVGVLMEVCRAVRLRDGKLLILATAVQRFKVLRARQHLPFSVADVELLFDDELINAWRDPAMAQVLDAATDTAGVPSIFAACDVAARAATAAVVARWQEGYELALARAWCWLGAPREGASDAETAHLVQQELANGVQEVVPLPDGVVIGRRQLAELAAAASADADAAIAAAVAALLTPAATTTTTACLPDPAPSCAPASAHEQLADVGDRLAEGGTPQSPIPATPVVTSLNTVTERGVLAAQDGRAGFGDADDMEAASSGEARPKEDVLQLEKQLWVELDTLAALAFRVGRNRVSLPFGLLQLRPPPAEAASTGDGSAATTGNPKGQAAAGEGDAEAAVKDPYAYAASDGLDVYADPAYPPLQRAARLSYAAAITLLQLTPSEGRQALLEVTTISGRLSMVVRGLAEQRRVLAAMASLRAAVEQ